MLSYFFPPKEPREIIRENQRALLRASRDLIRERANIEREEKRIVQELKQKAQLNQMVAVRALARDVVHKRAIIDKMGALNAQLNAVHSQLSLMKTVEVMGKAMMGASKAMASINKQLNLPTLNRAMMDFEKQNALMEQTTELMNGVMENALSGPEEMEVSDKLVDELMDELGLQTKSEFLDVPMNSAENNEYPYNPELVSNRNK